MHSSSLLNSWALFYQENSTTTTEELESRKGIICFHFESTLFICSKGKWKQLLKTENMENLVSPFLFCFFLEYLSRAIAFPKLYTEKLNSDTCVLIIAEVTLPWALCLRSEGSGHRHCCFCWRPERGLIPSIGAASSI